MFGLVNGEMDSFSVYHTRNPEEIHSPARTRYVYSTSEDNWSSLQPTGFSSLWLARAWMIADIKMIYVCIYSQGLFLGFDSNQVQFVNYGSGLKIIINSNYVCAVKG